MFWRAIYLLEMPYLEHVITFCNTNNINKKLHFKTTECLIEISKCFQQRLLKVKNFISGILLQDECWYLSRIIISKINDILSDRSFLQDLYFVKQKHG